MNYVKRLEEIIKSEKWIRNDIGMGRIQYVKLVRMNEELIVFILSNSNPKPLFSRVEDIIVINNEFMVFYDGEYPELITEDEYESYKEVLSKDEWKVIFGKDSGTALEEIQKVSKKDGFYLRTHQDMEKIIQEPYDKEATEEICKQFNLMK